MSLLIAGAQAADELASALLGFKVQKAIDPLSPSGFLLIGQLVAKKLSTAVKGAEADVVSEVIGQLGFDWATLSPEAATSAMDAVNQAISDSYVAKVLPKISDVFEVEGFDLMKSTRRFVRMREKLDIQAKLAQRDLTAESSIRKSQVNFIRHSTGERATAFSDQARKIVTRGAREGIGSDKIAIDLREHFAKHIPRPESYWRTVADSFIGRARTSSQLFAYEDAGVETFEVVAVLDNVTTDQCRFMDGKTFAVTTARSVLDSLQSLDDPEDVKFANPWIRKGKDPDGGMRLFVPHADGGTTTIAKIERSGVGSGDDRGKFTGGKSSSELGSLGVPCPPFHGRCRTTIVASSSSSPDESSAPVMVPGADLDAPSSAAPAAEELPNTSDDDDVN